MKLPTQKFVYVFTSATFVATILLSIAASSKGAKLVDVEHDIRVLESENRSIETNLIAKDSLKKISETSHELGLTKTPLVIYWNQDVSVATAH